MGEPLISIRDLTVALPPGADRAHAVDGVSLAINPNEILCIVGESGSGKSLTAHAVMGLLPRGVTASGGQILFGGTDLLRLPPSGIRKLRGQGIAMIFQDPMAALNPVVPIGRQITEQIRAHRTISEKDALDLAAGLLAEMGLKDPRALLKSFPHQLSGGQRQRVMIAMALSLSPKLLIADEPTTALDVTTQAQILKLIKRIQTEREMSVLFITHDFGVVADIADRVVVMQHGNLVESGTRDEVLLSPKMPYTQMLIASVPSLVPPHREPVSGAVALQTVNLSKTYQGTGGFLDKERIVKAADQVNLTLRRGETLGVVGESGSGKSTVARCIARLIDPSEGQILLDGLDIAHLPEKTLRPHRRHVQVIFQDPFRSLNPRRTVGQSIIEGPMNFGLSEHDAMSRARELMGLVGLSPDALSRFPHQFSGGQRQRISIARALAMQPHVLIADEAVSALDVSVQAQVLALLDDVRKRFDLALLFITHDLRVAAQICDGIMVMQKGKVVEEGATGALFANPQHPYTKALFDAAPGHDFSKR